MAFRYCGMSIRLPIRIIRQAIALLCLGGVLLVCPSGSTAFETDQYDLPSKPLADIGDEVSEHVELKLRKAIEKLNSEIASREKCVTKPVARENKSDCDSIREERAKLEYLRSNDAVVHEAYKQLGAGIPPFTSMGTWMNSHHFRGHPARYRTNYWKSIFLFLPHIYFTISPTVNLYGSEFGTDKIAHFFQQGYTYYKIYRHGIAGGLTPDEAERKAISWGQRSENTFYGTLVSGVYSNGDLFANYAGMKFYLGLTSEIRIGATRRVPRLVLKDGFWAFNDREDLSGTLLKPFISDHLNEALNPSIFTEFLGLRSFLRRTVRKRSCNQWFERYPNLSPAQLNEKSQSLKTWYGEDYGFTDSLHFVTIANVCFGDTTHDDAGAVARP